MNNNNRDENILDHSEMENFMSEYLMPSSDDNSGSNSSKSSSLCAAFFSSSHSGSTAYLDCHSPIDRFNYSGSVDGEDIVTIKNPKEQHINLSILTSILLTTHLIIMTIYTNIEPLTILAIRLDTPNYLLR